ncbi:chorismate mutase [Candidatus Peregrinibacteria bacterium]|nr:chorismate mutase [Candidatus Peregrinibacteria bacterium]
MAGSLQDLRAQIEEIDKGIIKLFSKRHEFVRKIGEVKQGMDLPVGNQEFENQKLENYTQVAAARGLSADFIQNIFEEVFWEARRVQEEMTKEG